MSKSNHFIGQPSFNQILKLINFSEIDKIIEENKYDKYFKKLDSKTYLKTYLYGVLCGYNSIRELTVGLLSNANKLKHIDVKYCVKRSTFSFSNNRRSSAFFAQVYQLLYKSHAKHLLDSRKKKQNLYIIDSTTITLFS